MDEALAVHTPSLLLPATLGGRAIAVWDSWQGKGRERFFYHTELFADMAVHVLTLVHHMHVWLLHGMSFHLLDALLLLDTRVVVMSFVQRVRAHMRHRCVLVFCVLVRCEPFVCRWGVPAGCIQQASGRGRSSVVV